VQRKERENVWAIDDLDQDLIISVDEDLTLLIISSDQDLHFTWKLRHLNNFHRDLILYIGQWWSECIFKVKLPAKFSLLSIITSIPTSILLLLFCDHAADKARQVVSSSLCAYCASVAHETCSWVHFWSERGNFRVHREGETSPSQV